jgi:hypothetical protein
MIGEIVRQNMQQLFLFLVLFQIRSLCFLIRICVLTRANNSVD